MVLLQDFDAPAWVWTAVDIAVVLGLVVSIVLGVRALRSDRRK
ncbi:hypothetical protein GCM10022243_16200 [Saccharothrix violaceirubra]|uniref:Uncharacterized protein n=1 Tax=Saccharothrix violaceirubra TaxID=413306 RepID=A0A7W7T6Y8_9PSEU|nr:hypothetical protein [Saccharothrix violaceirubra]MBB4967690.1 hypothetical protein [Saccharothrix violaceirubra]